MIDEELNDDMGSCLEEEESKKSPRRSRKQHLGKLSLSKQDNLFYRDYGSLSAVLGVHEHEGEPNADPHT